VAVGAIDDSNGGNIDGPALPELGVDALVGISAVGGGVAGVDL